jgi:hypothetical protein
VHVPAGLGWEARDSQLGSRIFNMIMLRSMLCTSADVSWPLTLELFCLWHKMAMLLLYLPLDTQMPQPVENVEVFLLPHTIVCHVFHTSSCIALVSQRFSAPPCCFPLSPSDIPSSPFKMFWQVQICSCMRAKSYHAPMRAAQGLEVTCQCPWKMPPRNIILHSVELLGSACIA